MALVKVATVGGAEVELEIPAELADEVVAKFAKFVANGKVPENRTVVDRNQSFYIDYSKVAVIYREF